MTPSPDPVINGSWSEWSSWSSCAEDCSQTRNRSCDNPPPQYGGLNCSGHDAETSVCHGEDCCPQTSIYYKVFNILVNLILICVPPVVVPSTQILTLP